MGLEKQLEKLLSVQESWDKCSICNRSLPPGTPVNKLYDDRLGSVTACIDCTLKAILWYVRKLRDPDADLNAKS